MSGNDSIDRLSSWKDIAAWFGVSVRTVQRWEKEEDLPIHRHRHARLSSVFTSKLELEQWWASRPDLQTGRDTASPQPKRTLTAPKFSLAVLPFVNLSGDQETEVLSDGLSEELTTALSQVESLLVVARTSAFHFKGKSADIRMVGRRLGVELVLEGSVRRSGDRLRISAQLVKASDGYHLWARQFDRRMQDLLDIEEETCRAIVEALRLKLVGRGQEDRLISGYTRDIEAYRLYLKGRYFFAKRLPQALLNAIGCFERALVRDPAMAPAYAGLADCHVRLGSFALAPPNRAYERAKAASLRALDLDGRVAEAHLTFGFVTAVSDYDWLKGEEEFRRAIELQPYNVDAHNLYSSILLCQGRFDEGELELAVARRLDPLGDLHPGAGFFHICRRQYDRAIETLSRAREVDPASPYVDYWLGEALVLEGRFKEAIAAFERVEARAFGAGLKGYCYGRTGRVLEARQLVDGLKSGDPYPALQIALLYLGLQEMENVFCWLERSVELRSLGIHWIKVDPIWDPIRPDARFLRLLQRMNLAE